MASTMTSILDGLIDTQEENISVASDMIADFALMGAQGNSGVILSQFFMGLADGFKGKGKVDISDLALAINRSYSMAADALDKPVEGTILSVMKSWSLAFHKQNLESTIPELFLSSIQTAQEALARTPEQLKVLKDAGVVDSGAQGFIYFLEGIQLLLEKGSSIQNTSKIIESASVNYHHNFEKPTFQYCTECLIIGIGIDKNQLKKTLHDHGDSLIVAGSKNKIKIHIHTDSPQNVFEVSAKYGKVQHQKADDMITQSLDANQHSRIKIGLVTDSACDLPDELYKKYVVHMIPMQIIFGENQFLDKVSISVEKFYEYVANDKNFPRTSLPRPSDIKRTYSYLNQKYDHVLAIHALGTVTGTYQAAKKMAENISPDIHVYDSGTASIGMGLLINQIGQYVQKGNNLEDTQKYLAKLIDTIHCYAMAGTIDNIIRSGRVSKNMGKVAKFFKITPIVGFKKDKKIQIVGAGFGKKSTHKKLLKLVRKSLKNKTNVSFAISHQDNQEAVDWLTLSIKNEFNLDPAFITNIGPSLGVHAGRGAVGWAMIETTNND
jgi:DegV family protein with EDD domain